MHARACIWIRDMAMAECPYMWSECTRWLEPLYGLSVICKCLQTSPEDWSLVPGQNFPYCDTQCLRSRVPETVRPWQWHETGVLNAPRTTSRACFGLNWAMLTCSFKSEWWARATYAEEPLSAAQKKEFSIQLPHVKLWTCSRRRKRILLNSKGFQSPHVRFPFDMFCMFHDKQTASRNKEWTSDDFLTEQCVEFMSYGSGYARKWNRSSHFFCHAFIICRTSFFCINTFDRIKMH